MDKAWLQLWAVHIIERSARTCTGLHSRPDCQWIYCLQGSVTVTLADRAMVVGAGSSLLVPPTVLRSYDGHGKQDVRFMLMHFSSSLIDSDMWPKEASPLPVDLQAEAVELSSLILSNKAGNKHEIEVLFLRILLACQRSREILPAGNPAADTLLAMADRYIEAHLSQPITRSMLAEACFCSPTHLARLIRQRRGSTIHQLIVDARMLQARHLLLNTGDSINMIATNVGFTTASHFTATFKGHHGLTPRQYRAQGGRHISLPIDRSS